MTDIQSASPEETFRLAEAVGRILRGGEVFELVSDVGGGKTAFVKGLARGLAIEDTVQSPTFTISRLYHARDNLELHHFDFYRLSEAGVIAAELVESFMLPNVIVAIEWGEIVHDVLPKARITIQIIALTETTRQLTIAAPKKYEYVITAVERFKDERSLR